MDIEVHPEDWKKEFGFGKAIALPVDKKSSMKKSKSLHDTPEMLEGSTPGPAKQKKGQSLAGKLKRFIKIKKRKTDNEITASKQAQIPASPSFVPNRTAFAIHNSSNPTSYGSTDQLNFSSEETEQMPLIAKGLDMDEVPAYAMHILDLESAGIGPPAASNVVRMSCLSPSSIPDSATKLYSFSRGKKFGFSLSLGLPPIEVSHVTPGGQAASLGLGVGFAVVEVNGEDCSRKTGREIRDLAHLGKVVSYSPSLGVRERGRISGFNQSGQDISGQGLNSFSQDLGSVDEDTWEKMKKLEESIQSKSSGTKEVRNSSPLFARQRSEPKTTDGSPTRESPRLKTKFTHAENKEISQMMMMSTARGESPLQHSTPVYVKGRGVEEQATNKAGGYSSSILSSDEGTSPLDELPRASLVLPDEQASDLQHPRPNLSTSSSESGPIINLPRASLMASLHEAGNLPGIPESEPKVARGDEIDSALIDESFAQFSYLDSSPKSDRKDARLDKPRKSPNVAVRSSRHSPATRSKQGLRSSPAAHSRTRKTFGSDFHTTGGDTEDDGDDEEGSSSDGIDEDDIVKSFEEVIASSPPMSPAKLSTSSGFVDLSPSQSPTPQWLLDADIRRSAQPAEADSKISNKKVSAVTSILKKVSAGSKKQLNFAELPLSSSEHGGLKHSLSGELLPLDSNFYVKKSLSKYDRARSMEDGINIDRESNLTSSINIESNVRRKKSGLMVGKRTSHSTSRPTILGYSQGGEGGMEPDESRRMSDDFGYQVELSPEVHHARSLSDELVLINERCPEKSPSPQPRPPKSPVLLGVNEGRSRLMLGKQRKRRKPSTKHPLFLDTSEESKYSEEPIDLGSPKTPEQLDGAGRGGGTRKPAKTNPVPTMPKPVLKKPTKVPEKKREIAEENKFKNLVIGASWGMGGSQGAGGGGGTGGGGPIARRSTYSARTSTATTAALVAQAAAKKSQELNKTIASGEQDADESLNALKRNTRHSSVNAHVTMSQYRNSPVKGAQNDDKVTPDLSAKVSANLLADVGKDKSSQSGIPLGTGVQTFKVPLRKVPQNTRLWEDDAGPNKKSKESLSASKPQLEAGSKPTAKTSKTPSSGGPVTSERSDISIPRSGHVKDKLKIFSQMT